MGEDLSAALNSAADWIEAAHDATGRCGISGGYDLRHGWLPAYPETSGYSIPTLLRAGRRLDRPGLIQRAREVGDWLLEIQLPNGSFPGDMGTDGPPVVFDVGQILLGLVGLWRTERRPAMLMAIERAATWLCDEQDADGAWTRHAFLGVANTYSTRVAWAVAEVWRETQTDRYRDCVEHALAWTLRNVSPDGWIDCMAFRPGQAPYTHTIAYTLRGLLRCAELIEGDLGTRCADIATTAAQRLAELKTPLFPLLPGQIAENFAPAADYACLTGDAQMVTVWLDAAGHRDLPELVDRCETSIERLLELQVRQPLEPAAVGALPGSWPLSGGYEPSRFPNWATKFLADALLNVDEARRRRSCAAGSPVDRPEGRSRDWTACDGGLVSQP